MISVIFHVAPAFKFNAELAGVSNVDAGSVATAILRHTASFWYVLPAFRLSFRSLIRHRIVRAIHRLFQTSTFESYVHSGGRVVVIIGAL
jgi:hypothetical protein